MIDKILEFKEENKVMSETKIMKIFIQICEALKYIH